MSNNHFKVESSKIFINKFEEKYICTKRNTSDKCEKDYFPLCGEPNKWNQDIQQKNEKDCAKNCNGSNIGYKFESSKCFYTNSWPVKSSKNTVKKDNPNCYKKSMSKEEAFGHFYVKKYICNRQIEKYYVFKDDFKISRNDYWYNWIWSGGGLRSKTKSKYYSTQMVTCNAYTDPFSYHPHKVFSNSMACKLFNPSIQLSSDYWYKKDFKSWYKYYCFYRGRYVWERRNTRDFSKHNNIKKKFGFEFIFNDGDRDHPIRYFMGQHKINGKTIKYMKMVQEKKKHDVHVKLGKELQGKPIKDVKPSRNQNGFYCGSEDKDCSCKGWAKYGSENGKWSEWIYWGDRKDGEILCKSDNFDFKEKKECGNKVRKTCGKKDEVKRQNNLQCHCYNVLQYQNKFLWTYEEKRNRLNYTHSVITHQYNHKKTKFIKDNVDVKTSYDFNCF